MDQARNQGQDIMLDTYPYLPGSTTLAALMPSWASSGGPTATLERLRDPEVKERIRVDMEDAGCDGGHGVPMGWSMIEIGSSSHAALSSAPSRILSHLAQDLSKPPIDLFFELLLTDSLATSCLMHVGNEENVREIMLHETHMGGSDAIVHGDTVHPRAYGTFPRFLGHYSRELSSMPMVEMITHLTSRPAKRMGIYHHRGCIAVGSAADLVLLDPDHIRDCATFDKRKERAEGIKSVLY